MKSLERGIRMDLLIAVCALLISSLAMAASWLQSRETARQTQVLEEQLSAQVWPYVGISEKLDGDTARFSAQNDGLGPAVLRSLTLSVDGKPKSTFIDVAHAILGLKLVERRHGESIGLEIDNGEPGSVIRPGDSMLLFALKSKTFARPLLYAYKRIDVVTCYCAIVPGKCWRKDTSTDDPPQPVTDCPEISGDVLHSPVLPDPRLL